MAPESTSQTAGTPASPPPEGIRPPEAIGRAGEIGYPGGIARGHLASPVVIGLLAGLVALVPTVLLLAVQQRDSDRLENRLRGQQYLAAVAPLTSALPWHRDLSTRLLLRDPSVEGAARRAASEVRSALRQGSAMTARHGEALALSSRWQDLAARWAWLESRYPRLSAPDNVEAHNRLLEQAGEFIALIAQRSELLVEPAAGARFLILCNSVDIPALAHQTAMLRAHALLAGPRASADRRARTARTIAEARTALDRVAADLEAAFAANEASRALLEPRTAHALELVRQVLAQASVAGAPDEPDGSAWFSATTQAVESLQGVHDAVAERVATLLAGQAERLRARRRATQALAVLVGSCTLLGVLVLGRRWLRSPRGKDAPMPGTLAGDHPRPPADQSA